MRLRVSVAYFFEGLPETVQEDRQFDDPITALAMLPGGVELAASYLTCDARRRRAVARVALELADTMSADRADRLAA